MICVLKSGEIDCKLLIMNELINMNLQMWLPIRVSDVEYCVWKER